MTSNSWKKYRKDVAGNVSYTNRPAGSVEEKKVVMTVVYILLLRRSDDNPVPTHRDQQ